MSLFNEMTYYSNMFYTVYLPDETGWLNSSYYETKNIPLLTQEW